MVKNKVKRTERGYMGHFCCADRCRFRRNTLIEFGKVKIVVSTVGNLIIDNQVEPMEGIPRYYETAAFHAQKHGSYLDADHSKQIYLEGVKWCVDNFKETADLEADEMHENYIKEIIKRFGGKDAVLEVNKKN